MPMTASLQRSLLRRKSLDIRASVGTSTSPTSTGTKAVTGVGFTPKVVLPWNAWLDSNINAVDLGAFFGAATSASSRASIAYSSLNARTTSVTHRRHTSSRIVTQVYNGATSLEADLSSLDADGFTFNWSAVNASANILNHICLGGADLEVSLTQQQMNGTNAAQSFAHGLSGAPTGVLFFSALNSTAPANTSTILDFSIGAWAGSSQWGASIFSSSGVTTTSTRRTLATTYVLGDLAATLQRSMAVSTVDATNVNVTYPTTTASTQSYFWMLAFRGAKAQVGTFDCNGSTSPLTISTTGIRPKLFLPVFVPSGVSSVGTVQTPLLLGIGASDGTNNVSCGISDQTAVTTTDARRWQSSNKLAEYTSAGVLAFEATAAFSGESVVVTPTLAGSGRGQGGFLVIGN